MEQLPKERKVVVCYVKEFLCVLFASAVKTVLMGVHSLQIPGPVPAVIAEYQEIGIQ